MDKKLLLSSNLARIMVDYVSGINELVELLPVGASTLKPDGTPVTELDLRLSELCEKMADKNYPNVTFYSEEKYSNLNFPLMAVDPIDGTKEYLAGRAEWVVSIGLFESKDFSGQGWVYNPITKELFDGQDSPKSQKVSSILLGEVSRSEWGNNLFKNFKSTDFEIKPVGSIAYKLGRLSTGKSDFVISLYPKSIWDIAAGTILCKKSKIKFYEQGRLVTEVKEKYYPPLIWCREETFSKLFSLL